MNPRAELATAIGRVIGTRLQPTPGARVHGGSINECRRWQSDGGPLFVKVAPASRQGMFEAEAAGLEELRRARAVRVPHVLGIARTANEVALTLEWIELRPGSEGSESLLGKQLAAQHRMSASAFGWDCDNTIGGTPQLNGWCAEWVEFFRERRLVPQLERARANGFDGELQDLGRKLLPVLDRFFSQAPEPSLLHGDLWGGNRGVDERGTPVIFDPAVYFGDRVADIAMTRLFGGFGADFHAAYEAAWPMTADAHRRMLLYNLYHVLNHLNLFGRGYLAQALGMLERLLAWSGGR